MILFTKVLGETLVLEVLFINGGVGVYGVSYVQPGLPGFG